MASSRLFDEDFLRKLEYLRLVSRQLVLGSLKGEHRSRKRGGGIEFADYRPYVEGDDIRHVDWPAYLRFEKLLVRMFEEEGDLSIYLFLDCSASLGEGSARKFRQARRLAAALSYIGLANLDRVTVIPYRRGAVNQPSELRGANSAMGLFVRLEHLEAKGDTDLNASARAFFARPRRKGLVVLVSDFFDQQRGDALDAIQHLGHDLLAIQITASHEEDAARALGPEMVLVDSESQAETRIRTTPTLLSDYRRIEGEIRERFAADCRSRGWGHYLAPAEAPLEDLVLGVFRQGRFVK